MKKSNFYMQDLKSFIDTHVKVIEPIFLKTTESIWNSETSGKEEDYKKREDCKRDFYLIYSCPYDYQRLEKIKNNGKINDPLLKRQLKLLIESYKSKQLPKDLLDEMVVKSTKIGRDFNTFRGMVDGKRISQNDIERVLLNSQDSEERKKYWNAQKSVGEKVYKDLLDLVKLRNKSARKLGFENYYTMSLDLQEIDDKWLKKIFNKLYKKTEKGFRKVKEELDRDLAKKFNISHEEIMPWHYSDPFFQKYPILTDDFDKVYKKHDIISLAKQFYAGIGLPIDNVLANSDLYEREGKCPHAFCIFMDKKDDVRILMNATNTINNMDTILHEAGHAVYDLGIDNNLPFLLRDTAHTFVTEAIAMMFGKLAYSGKWMQSEMNLNNHEAQRLDKLGHEINQKQQLILSRWIQVMVNFERELYNNPEQDLNSLWWDFVEKYQHIKKPQGRNKPDYASKIHLTIAPVYYHNYQLGELLASQFNNYIKKNITQNKPYNYNSNIGKYLNEKVFKPGASMEWNKLIKFATGKKLKPKYFLKEYC